jgi:hypothetical protein
MPCRRISSYGELPTLTISEVLQTQFEAGLRNKAIPQQTHGLYKKWLRYYLGFCHKYHVPHAHGDSLVPFLNKLQEKKQTKAQQQQASQAIAMYDELIHASDARTHVPSATKDRPLEKAPHASSHRTAAAANEATTSRGRPQARRERSPDAWVCL